MRILGIDLRNFANWFKVHISHVFNSVGVHEKCYGSKEKSNQVVTMQNENPYIKV